MQGDPIEMYMCVCVCHTMDQETFVRFGKNWGINLKYYLLSWEIHLDEHGTQNCTPILILKKTTTKQ